MENSFKKLILAADFFKIDLKNKSHRVEKEWHIKYSICHREDLPSYCVWDEISESYRRCGDNGKVKCIKITPILCSLKVMDEKSSKEPTS